MFWFLSVFLMILRFWMGSLFLPRVDHGLVLKCVEIGVGRPPSSDLVPHLRLVGEDLNYLSRAHLN